MNGARDIDARLAELQAAMLHLEAFESASIQAAPPERRPSLRNLLHYLALRRHDLRELQMGLASLGLSSLGRSEPAVLDQVSRVRRALAALIGAPEPLMPDSPVTFESGPRVLTRAAEALLGPEPDSRRVRIMATMPTEAAGDPGLVERLLAAGMDVMRINCAHDTPTEWERIVEHLRAARDRVGRACRVLVDIAGPKARTGPISPGPSVIRWNPPRDELGALRHASVIRLTAKPLPTTPEPPPMAPVPWSATLPIPAALAAKLRPGSELRFTDCRGLPRRLTIHARAGDDWLAHSPHAAYVTPGTRLVLSHGKDDTVEGEVGALPPIPRVVTLNTGEELVLTADPSPGVPEVRDAGGVVVQAARIPFTLPEAFADVAVGHRVMLDDGKIAGVIVSTSPGELRVRVTRCRPGARLAADKGVNLPDTPLSIPALTPRDLEDLSWAATRADMIGYSFVRTPEDVELLRGALQGVRGTHLGVVLKIETRAAFERLPALLAAAMRWPAAGVMIARGDLAVELGWERTAEVQEEILWLCEAAHTPVIWATQVLETLAKKGLPSRSEITDAAMGERAECVMLNKGPFIVDAVRTLDDILRRMAGHQSKKRAMMRPLRVAGPSPDRL